MRFVAVVCFSFVITLGKNGFAGNMQQKSENVVGKILEIGFIV